MLNKPGNRADLTEAMQRYMRASRAENTWRAYAEQWQRFEAWCEPRTMAALPAEPVAVARRVGGGCTMTQHKGSHPQSRRQRANSEPLPVTSSWSVELPAGYARIGISRGLPRRQRGFRVYRALAPGPWFRSVSAKEFRNLYMAQLDELDPRQVLRDLAALAEGGIPALLCFEGPPPDPAWCHRGLVSAWLADSLKLSVCEFDHEEGGSGWSHPKLPEACRRPRSRD
jgi:hypothetical protein